MTNFEEIPIDGITITYGTTNRALIAADGKYFVAEYTDKKLVQIFDVIEEGTIPSRTTVKLMKLTDNDGVNYQISYCVTAIKTDEYDQYIEIIVALKETSVVKIDNGTTFPPVVHLVNGVWIEIGCVENPDIKL